MNPFDMEADRYDLWFESGEGKAVFEIEKSCLRMLIPRCEGRWLEVGVGTGRFAQALGISEGVDPSLPMLAIAARRRIHTIHGAGECLPYQTATFDGVLMVTTICFLANVKKAVAETHRVLRPNGVLVAGIVPAESPWGLLYREKGRKGHPFYSVARFHTCREVVRICTNTGFAFDGAASGLTTPPGEEPVTELERGINESAGFVAMRFKRGDLQRHGSAVQNDGIHH